MRSNQSSSKPVPGQRWVSRTEPELGLGILVSCSRRILEIHFPGTDCSRQYSTAAAPIQRIIFSPGDTITTSDKREFTVDRLIEEEGTMIYQCTGHQIHETEIGPFLSIALPQERLLAGLAGSSNLFDLRKKTLFSRSRYHRSGTRGFLGGRVDLIPHQFYIADQVCRRPLPRVLLSDETGLGKTVEAGLILHRMMTAGQIQRVLIIVPDALVHQWFIELFRKFNLSFRLLDLEFVRETDSGTNPFLRDQQGISGLSLIMESRALQSRMLEAGWDMVVMDEAHHILDDPEFYDFMQALGKQTRGMLLLTATPEQMGPDTHFAQLRLLDPDRYFDPEIYAHEAKGYEATADQVKRLLADGKPVDRVLDTFGPGRVVFRNLRASIKGFPGRNASLTPLSGMLPSPEEEGGPMDPRVISLAELARSIKPEKILVICAKAHTAEKVQQSVQSYTRVDAARFDETMTLMQRDRQAAWFAREDGARLLICSEIGSEGRNFQFVHHLFLFDLPGNPELLEQRIGRLDRIGQKNDIQIHLPYIQGSDQEILARWYSGGLGLLEKNISGTFAIFTRFKPELERLIQNCRESGSVDKQGISKLIRETARYTELTQAAQERGRHILLEMNSFRPKPAQALIDHIRAMDEDPSLHQLMEALLDHYGIDMDLIRDMKGDRIVTLSMDRMADESFPSLPKGCDIITFDRRAAVEREDIGFLNWDHPFVGQVLEYFLTQEEGASAVAKLASWPEPGLFLETIFLFEVPGGKNLSPLPAAIPADPIHLLMNHAGEQVKEMPEAFFENRRSDLPGWFLEMDELKARLIPLMMEKSMQQAEKEAAVCRAQMLEQLNATLGNEISRLEDLSKINPGISEKEILTARSEYEMQIERVKNARIRLDSVCLIRTA